MNFKDFIPSTLTVLLITLGCMCIQAQENTLVSFLDNTLVSVDEETVQIEEVLAFSPTINETLRGFPFNEQNCVFYGVAGSSTGPFSLYQFDLEGNTELIGELSLADGTIFSCEGIAFNTNDGKLYIASSLNGSSLDNDFYAESILEVNTSTAVCEKVVEVDFDNGDRSDIDAMGFAGNTLYIFDGQPPSPNVSKFYELDFSNIDADVVTPTLFLTDRYLPIRGLIYEDEKIYAPTGDAEFYEIDLEENTLNFLGVTHNIDDYNGKSLRGGSFIPNSKLPAKNTLVAHYPFNGNANDESGNGNDGVVNGATLTEDRFGNSNAAYSFDGVDDFIEIQDHPNLRLGNSSYTFSVWVYVESYSNEVGHTIIGKRGDGNEDGYLLSLYGNDRADNRPQGQIDFIASKATDPSILSQSVMEAGAWHHLVLVGSKEDNTTKIYINGNIDQTQEFIELSATNNRNLFFGKDELTDIGDFVCCDGFHFNGILDDLSIYCTAITEEEIEDLAQNDGNDSQVKGAPKAFTYQGLATDTRSGRIIRNRDISIEASIIKDELQGEVIYTEVHDLATDNFGFFSTAIGAGFPTLSDFCDIDWSSGCFFLQISIDTRGGSDYSLLGVTQLLSVPYALYAEQAGSVKNNDIIMKSPNGKCWKMSVNNEGQAIFTEVVCD